MKACLLHEPGMVTERPLRLEIVDTPLPGAGQVRIKVKVCGICRTDLHVVEGELDLARQKRPVIPGHQIVGTVDALGPGVSELEIADRVGVAWLHGTCGHCSYCSGERENLCDAAQFTGWTIDGGYAEYAIAPTAFVYRLPDAFDDLQVAPMLCAGIIGYRCLGKCAEATSDWSGLRLGLYGFGAAGHIAIQIARFRGAEVYVSTRDRERHQALAEELGAFWVGDTFDLPPHKLDAAIIFAPAGEIVPASLKALVRGGRLVLGGIHMSSIPEMEYADLYWERRIESVANNTRADGRAFLDEAARAGVRTRVQAFPLEAANDALIALKHDAIKGAGVLVMEED